LAVLAESMAIEDVLAGVFEAGFPGEAESIDDDRTIDAKVETGKVFGRRRVSDGRMSVEPTAEVIDKGPGE
jgi:hypothetical protein